MKQHLPRCHRHLQTRKKNGSAGVRRARTRRRRHFVPPPLAPLPLPLPTANSSSPRLLVAQRPPTLDTPVLRLGPAAREPQGDTPNPAGTWRYRDAAEKEAQQVGPGPEH